MSRRFNHFGLVVFALALLIAAFFATTLRVTFDFEDFFPQGDPDLEYFLEFRRQFEPDDNFLLVAFPNDENVFDQSFLKRISSFSNEARKLDVITNSTSLLDFQYPIKLPFSASSFSTIPALTISDTTEISNKEIKRIMTDPRLVGSLISEDTSTLVVALKTTDDPKQGEAEKTLAALHQLAAEHGFENYHLLGRIYFQDELVRSKVIEMGISTVVSVLLVTLIFIFLYRRFWTVFFSLVCIGSGMLFLLGLLGLLGRELNALAALYPVLMIIVGASDVIHIISKYIDELSNGAETSAALKTTIKEIGLATLLTSTTTAVGFLTLVTSKVQPIREFGVNAALGVLIAYVTVITLSILILPLLKKEQIAKFDSRHSRWQNWMEKMYQLTLSHSKLILAISALTFTLSIIGIFLVQTNYKIQDALPDGSRVKNDFHFFEKKFTGFRPFEFSIEAQGNYKVTDYEVMKSIHELEQHLALYPAVKNPTSPTLLYKSINRAYKANRLSAYTFPESKATFNKYNRALAKFPTTQQSVFISRDSSLARISSRVLDIGADSIAVMSTSINKWIDSNIDPSIIQAKMTGTGLIIDKNGEYVRDSILKGLGLAILIVSILMGILFKNIRMLILAIIPNTFPLLIAAALLGFTNTPLEAGISIIFAVIFGIAVDDTIHFFSKFKLALAKGMDQEQAIKITFMETGKAIIMTTIVLFLGFLVLLFSPSGVTRIVGWLISFTLIAAVLADLFLLPILIRWFIKK